MSTINYHKREIVAKIVYYGPALGGKTSSLEYIHRAAKGVRGDLISLTTDEDRTLYFDYLPVELPKLGGFTVRVQLYTVPGQVYYNATRKLVLDGADGVVFVADSQAARMSANTESLDNLCENLREKRCVLKGMPEIVAAGAAISNDDVDVGTPIIPEELAWVIQYNKRDLAETVPIARLEEKLNLVGVPAFEAVATDGQGILEALQSICMLVLADVRDKGRLREGEARLEAAKTLRQLGSAPTDDKGSMTATSLADITDVVANLADPDEGISLDLEVDEEPTTLSGVDESKPPQTPAQAHHVKAQIQACAEAQAHTPAKRGPSGRPTEAAIRLEERQEPPTSPGLPAVGPMQGRSMDETGNRGAALSRLIRSNTNREALVTVEAQVEQGNWKQAVEGAQAAFADFSATLARTRSPNEVIDPRTFAALATGVPAKRYLRFQKLATRLRVGDTLTTEDAVFALFFLADFLIRIDELKRHA